MSTKIEWTDETWNPITGCTKVSEGCRNCYAERMAKRLAGRCGYPADEPFRVTLHPNRLEQPLRWKKPRMVFVCSMGDLFHEDVAPDTIIHLFEVMTACPRHTFQVLTKRPDRMMSVLFGQEGHYYLGGGDYYPNIWLGVTAENQVSADERIPILFEWVGTTFVSCEPLLGPVDVSSWLPREVKMDPRGLFPSGTRPVKTFEYPHGTVLDWVIVGGETGPGARPMHPDWARDIRDQCQEAGVPFFMKQMSRREPIPDDLQIREMPGDNQ